MTISLAQTAILTAAAEHPEHLVTPPAKLAPAPRGPDAPTGIEAVVCCRDPDDTLVELIEYMPGVLGSRIDSLERRKT